MADAFGWFLAAHFAGFVTTIVAVGGVPEAGVSYPIHVTFLGATGLWLALGLGPVMTSRSRGRGPAEDYGTRVEPGDVPVGLALGAFTQVCVLWVLYWPLERWVDWFRSADPGASAEELVALADSSAQKALLVFMVVAIAPLVEEIFYRGMLLSALRFHLDDWASIAISAGVFALAHLQRVSLPGLFVFGLIAGYLRVRTGRLGASLFFHVGFNAVTVVILLDLWRF